MKQGGIWLATLIRANLVLLMAGTALAVLCPAWFQTPGSNWLAAGGLAPLAWALGLLGLAGWLASGWKTWMAALASGLGVVAWVVIVAWREPFHNFSQDAVIFLVLVVAWLAVAGRGDALTWGMEAVTPERAASAIALLARLFAGVIFFRQGWHNLVEKSPVEFARAVYVAPYAHSVLPSWLLWGAGIANPLVMFGGGILLLAGWKTRWVALGLMAFLSSIILGHMLAHPLGDLVDVRDYSLIDFAACAVAFVAAGRSDRWGWDGWRGWTGATAKPAA